MLSMKEVTAKSIIKDEKLAKEIIDLLLDRATQVDYVLKLVATSFITMDEQLANKLHIAMANTTTKLLQQKQGVMDLGNVTIPFAYNNDKLSKLDCEAKISYLLDICKVAFPRAKLEGHSEHSKRIFDDTITCLKQVIKKNNIINKQALLDKYSYKQGQYNNSYNYLVMLVENNNIFED
jgi:hypothetical protein